MLLILATCFLANTLLTAQVESCSVPKSNFKDFDINKYAHKWYELKRIPNIFEKYYTCEYDEYTKTAEGIKVVSRAYNTSTNSYETSNGEVESTTSNTFTIYYTNDKIWSQEYTVLGTDYSTYSIVIGCLKGIDIPLIWIAAQAPKMSPSVEETVEEILKQYNYDLSQFEPVPWSDCPEPPKDE